MGSTEKASYVSKDIGFVGEEESPEFFDERFNARMNNASMKKEESKLSELAHHKGIDLGYVPKEEILETFERVPTKQENANLRKSRKTVSDFAILEPKHLAVSTEQEASNDILEVSA